MHVLTLTPFYPVAGDDGRGCFVAEPIRAIAVFGIRMTTVACEVLHHGTPASDGDPHVVWVRYPVVPGNIGLPYSGALLNFRLRSVVNAIHATTPIDLIHAHAALPCGRAAALLARRLSIPYVVSVHGLDAFSRRQLRGSPGRQGAARVSARVYRDAHRVVCVSRAVEEAVRTGMSDAVRTTVVYNGVDLERFTPNGSSPTAAQSLLSVGNLIPTKGHALVVRALPRIVEKAPHVRYDIIGDGPERPALEALARQMGVASRVHFHGRRSRAEVADALRHCTVFVLPSFYEALGCVYLEAMAAAKPVIACRDQGIAEVIRHGDNGWLVHPDRDEELAAVLVMLLADPGLRNRIGTRSRDTVQNGFGLNAQAQRLHEIYRTSVVKHAVRAR
jgi:glycosyltransferase involved in cell wall biosynthesis